MEKFCDLGFEPTEPIVLDEEIIVAKIDLDYKIKEVKKNITEKSWLEIEVADLKKSIDIVKDNSACSSCDSVVWIMDWVKAVVDTLMSQISTREDKICLLNELVDLSVKENVWLKEVAYKDVLTGSYNRLIMDQLIIRNIAKADDKKYDFSVAIIDIDFFKQVNDQYGHSVWDEILKDFALFFENELEEFERNRDQLNWKRKSWRRNLLFRYWWEEFVVLSSTWKDNLKVFLDKCLNKYKKKVHSYEEEEFSVTFSWGITEYKWWKDWRSKDSIIRDADIFLYQAKEQWRARIVNA